jgi:membrane-associated phospholipid phosphatase
MLRHPDSPLVVPVWIATQAMAAGASTLRVFCREHFPTDVMAGAVAGGGIGLLVPWLHELPRRGPEHGRGDDAGIQVRPWLWEQGAGLTGTFF